MAVHFRNKMRNKQRLLPVLSGLALLLLGPTDAMTLC
jgi:hypothetical protein